MSINPPLSFRGVPQGHLLRGADWLAMTGFFDSLRKTAQRAVFLYFSRSAQQNRRGSNSLPGIPRMAEPFAGALPLPLDLTRFALVEAACSILPAAFQKETPSCRMVFLFVIAHRFCCPCALLYIARKGECEGETFAGFPTRVQSPARRRPILRSKIAAPKKYDHPKGGRIFLERATRLELATSTLARSRSTR